MEGRKMREGKEGMERRKVKEGEREREKVSRLVLGVWVNPARRHGWVRDEFGVREGSRGHVSPGVHGVGGSRGREVGGSVPNGLSVLEHSGRDHARALQVTRLALYDGSLAS